MIQATVRQIIAGDEDVRAMVSDRIYDMILPDDIKFPCIQMQRVSETLDTHVMARSTRMQIDAYSESHIEAVTLAETIQKALTNRTHSTGDVIITIQPKGMRDLSDVESRLFRVSGDYSIIWRIL